MNRSLALIGLIMASLLLCPLSIFAQSDQAAQTEETVWLETGDIFEILPVHSFTSPQYAWILTEGRQFLGASQDVVYRTRFPNPGTFTLTGEINDVVSGQRTRTVLRIKVVAPREEAPLREEVAVTVATPLVATTPSPVTVGRIVLPPNSTLLRLEPTTNAAPLHIDTNLAQDSNGDGNSANDRDTAETVFSNGQTPLYIWFANVIAEQPMTVFVGNDSSRTQDLTVFSFIEADNQQLSWVEARITQDNIDGGRYQFGVTFDGITPPGPLLYRWKFGDGKESLLSRPIHEYRSYDTFTVNVAIIDVTSGDEVFNINREITVLRPSQDVPITGGGGEGGQNGGTGQGGGANAGGAGGGAGTGGESGENGSSTGSTAGSGTGGGEGEGSGGLGALFTNLIGGNGSSTLSPILSRLWPLLLVFILSLVIGVLAILLLKKLFGRKLTPISKDIESMEKAILAKHDSPKEPSVQQTTVNVDKQEDTVVVADTALPAEDKNEEIVDTNATTSGDDPQPKEGGTVPHTALGEELTTPEPIHAEETPAWLAQGLKQVPNEELPPIVQDNDTSTPPAPPPQASVPPPVADTPPPPTDATPAWLQNASDSTTTTQTPEPIAEHPVAPAEPTPEPTTPVSAPEPPPPTQTSETPPSIDTPPPPPVTQTPESPQATDAPPPPPANGVAPPTPQEQESLPPWLQKGLQEAAKLEQEGKVPPGFTESSENPATQVPSDTVNQSVAKESNPMVEKPVGNPPPPPQTVTPVDTPASPPPPPVTNATGTTPAWLQQAPDAPASGVRDDATTTPPPAPTPEPEHTTPPENSTPESTATPATEQPPVPEIADTPPPPQTTEPTPPEATETPSTPDATTPITSSLTESGPPPVEESTTPPQDATVPEPPSTPQPPTPPPFVDSPTDVPNPTTDITPPAPQEAGTPPVAKDIPPLNPNEQLNQQSQPAQDNPVGYVQVDSLNQDQNPEPQTPPPGEQQPPQAA